MIASLSLSLCLSHIIYSHSMELSSQSPLNCIQASINVYSCTSLSVNKVVRITTVSLWYNKTTTWHYNMLWCLLVCFLTNSHIIMAVFTVVSAGHSLYVGLQTFCHLLLFNLIALPCVNFRNEKIITLWTVLTEFWLCEMKVCVHSCVNRAVSNFLSPQ